MVKEPRPGRVKTRLSPPCSPDQAAAIAAAAIADTLAAVQASGADRCLVALDGEPGDWLPRGCQVVAQVEGTLNERLAAAWSHTHGRTVQIAMDTPHISAGLLTTTFERVRPGWANLGLAEDGGWWLLGLPRSDARAFDGVPMSTTDTGRAQRRHLRRLGYRIDAAPALRDLDHFSDAVAIATAHPELRTAAAVRAVEADLERTPDARPLVTVQP